MDNKNIYLSHEESSTPKLSIILPCYNESEGIIQILDRFKLKGSEKNYELILVDNGSTDDTSRIIADNIDSYPFARYVKVIRNIGYGHGIITGLGEAAGEYLSWSHADLQTDPSDVFRAYRVLLEQSNPQKTIVKGIRRGRNIVDQIITRAMSIVAYFLLGKWVSEINAQPKVFHRSLLEHCKNPPNDFNLDTYFIFKAIGSGWDIVGIDVDFPPRIYGASKWASSWKSKLMHIIASIRFLASLGKVEGNDSK
jgi:polyisoprenyl-phosphate glycosyltransferase